MCQRADQGATGAPRLRIPDDALTAAGAAFLVALDRSYVILSMWICMMTWGNAVGSEAMF